MAFKTILSVIGAEQTDDDIKHAADLCATCGAHLSVLIVAASLPGAADQFGMVPDLWVQTRREYEEKLNERNTSTEALLSAREISGDVISAYEESASISGTVGLRGRYADLTVVGPDMMSGGEHKSEVIEGALFSSGKPVLLVPAGKKVTLTPSRVMVAWDTGLEAARAVREALDMLVAADAVDLVMVDPEEGAAFGQGDEPGADAATFLARHGVKVNVVRLPLSGRTASEVLCRHAVDMAAELIVMGGYGHARLRQLIFGGVTRSMLSQAPVPVLMAR